MPRLAAAPKPRFAPSWTHRAAPPGASARIASDSSDEAPSTTTTSSGERVCAATASRHPTSQRAPFQLGITTAVRMAGEAGMANSLAPMRAPPGPVLFVSYSGLWGGAERILLDIAGGLEAPAVLICPDGELSARAHAAGLPVLARPERPRELRGAARTRARAVLALAGHAAEIRERRSARCARERSWPGGCAA